MYFKTFSFPWVLLCFIFFYRNVSCSHSITLSCHIACSPFSFSCDKINFCLKPISHFDFPLISVLITLTLNLELEVRRLRTKSNRFYFSSDWWKHFYCFSAFQNLGKFCPWIDLTNWFKLNLYQKETLSWKIFHFTIFFSPFCWFGQICVDLLIIIWYG